MHDQGYFGDVPNLDQLANDLKCKQGKLPSTYLGLPLGVTYKQKEVWFPLVDMMKKRMNGWNAQYLSKEGRLTLIKATLASIPVHYLSTLVLPKLICTSLEKIQRDFLWRKGENGSGLHLVSWERVCTPKAKGGARLRQLKSMNKALLCKWLWRFGIEMGSLWRQVVATKFGNDDGWDFVMPNGLFGRSPWRAILQFALTFKEGIAYELGDGRRVKFWEDVWCGERALRYDFPNLWELAVELTSLVAANFSVCGREIVWNPTLRKNMHD